MKLEKCTKMNGDYLQWAVLLSRLLEKWLLVLGSHSFCPLVPQTKSSSSRPQSTSWFWKPSKADNFFRQVLNNFIRCHRVKQFKGFQPWIKKIIDIDENEVVISIINTGRNWKQTCLSDRKFSFSGDRFGAIWANVAAKLPLK